MDILQTITNPIYWKPVVEIGILFILMYVVLRFMRGTRGEGIFKGLALSVILAWLVLVLTAKFFELERLNHILDTVLQTAIIALLIIFQPELRRGLVRLGASYTENPFIRRFFKSEVNVLEEVVEAVVRLAQNKVGALIAIEREGDLRHYIEGGTRLDAEVRSALLETIFFPGSVLHDGAVIIQDQRVAAAGCLFPLTDNPDLSKKLGTRHRAAIGLSEELDAITIVVSEETGAISLGEDGKLIRDLQKDELITLLKDLYQGDDVSDPSSMNVEVLEGKEVVT